MELSNALLIGAYVTIVIQTINLLLRDYSVFKVLIGHTVPMALTFMLVTCGILFGGVIWMVINIGISVLISILCTALVEIVIEDK